ncbi:caspase family protein [Nocardia sp. NPDC004654]|uniref:caspase, EACC1-associated type n=1 Tax=Nocardia sp. NPDC004654 TaxID=3154776 RepID=UPI0033BA98A0
MAQAETGARLALVIASGHFVNSDLRDLPSASIDAKGMHSILSDQQIGRFSVTTLIDKQEHELRRQIEDFLSDRRKIDLIVVYTSSHGIEDPRGNLYFAATDTKNSRLGSTALESRWLFDRLEYCGARSQVVILDCCFSGSFDRSKASNNLNHHFGTASKGRVVMTASRASQYAYEEVTEATGNPAGSRFTNGLIRGLRTGDAGKRGPWQPITPHEAFTYARDYVKDRGADQDPQYFAHGTEGEICLALSVRSSRLGSRSDTDLNTAKRIVARPRYKGTRDGVVLIPDLGASRLVDTATGEMVWGGNRIRDVRRLLGSQSALFLDEGRKLAPAGLVPNPFVLPGFGGQFPYSKLVKAISRAYDDPESVAVVDYDWRLGTEQNSSALARIVEEHYNRCRSKPAFGSESEIVIIAHGYGALIAQAYTSSPEIQRIVRNTVAVGAPYRGTLRALQPFGNTIFRISRAGILFPSMYEMLPTYKAIADNDSFRHLSPDDVAEIGGDPGVASYALKRNEQIASVDIGPVTAIVGVGQPTPHTARIHDGKAELFSDAETIRLRPEMELDDGDGIVLAPCATRADPFLGSSLIFPQRHGTLLDSNEVIGYIMATVTAGTDGGSL